MTALIGAKANPAMEAIAAARKMASSGSSRESSGAKLIRTVPRLGYILDVDPIARLENELVAEAGRLVERVLEGSVQADGSRVDVTAQLIDAGSGAHVWASRYTREEEAIVAIQVEVVGRVAGTLAGFAGAIARTELARARRAPPASLHAYELHLLGYEQEARLDRDGTFWGIELLEAAVAADPGLSRAWTVLGFAFGNAVGYGWTDDPGSMRARQREAIRRAVEFDPAMRSRCSSLGACSPGRVTRPMRETP